MVTPRGPEGDAREAADSGPGDDVLVVPGAQLDVIAAALDDAVAATLAYLAHTEPSDECRPIVLEVRDAVMDVLRGRAPQLVPRLRTGVEERILGALRAQLSTVSHPGRVLNPWETVRLINAMSRVEARLTEDAASPDDDASAELEGLAPVVEVAHDLRSPLAAVLFLLEMIRSGRSGPVNAVQQQQLRLIHSSVLALNQVACDLIDFVRGAERFEQHGDDVFSMAAVLQSVVDIVQPMADEKSVSVEMITPPADTRLGRSSLIRRVILNLAVNAIQYADRGVVMVSARETSDERVEFSVQDSGRNVPAQVVPHLFRAFRPAGDARSRVFSSSGLGLAVCHRLVTRLGGILMVDSAPDIGTRFHFTIPLPRA